MVSASSQLKVRSWEVCLLSLTRFSEFHAELGVSSQAKQDCWFQRSQRWLLLTATPKTRTRQRRRNSETCWRKETFTSTPEIWWGSMKRTLSTFRIEWETPSGPELIQAIIAFSYFQLTSGYFNFELDFCYIVSYFSWATKSFSWYKSTGGKVRMWRRLKCLTSSPSAPVCRRQTFTEFKFQVILVCSAFYSKQLKQLKHWNTNNSFVT